MAAVLRRILDYEMTIAEWIGLMILVHLPYVLLGVAWTLWHPAHLAGTDGLEKAAALVGGIAFWPVLLVAQACPA